jgi:hypothetical protein
MSDPLSVGMVVEGPTDFVVLRAAIAALLDNRDFEVTSIQPLLSNALKAHTGGGWTAIYRWCRPMLEQAGGRAQDNSLFNTYDLLILHVDADVAGKRYSDDQKIQDAPEDLPCERHCPPANATTDALRRVVLGWLNIANVLPRTILCTPSKSTETWVLAALFPDDVANSSVELECRADAATVMQSKPLNQRLRKRPREYEKKKNDLRIAWPHVRTKCSEAERFSQEFSAALPSA